VSADVGFAGGHFFLRSFEFEAAALSAKSYSEQPRIWQQVGLLIVAVGVYAGNQFRKKSRGKKSPVHPFDFKQIRTLRCRVFASRGKPGTIRIFVNPSPPLAVRLGDGALLERKPKIFVMPPTPRAAEHPCVPTFTAIHVQLFWRARRQLEVQLATVARGFKTYQIDLSLPILLPLALSSCRFLPGLHDVLSSLHTETRVLLEVFRTCTRQPADIHHLFHVLVITALK